MRIGIVIGLQSVFHTPSAVGASVSALDGVLSLGDKAALEMALRWFEAGAVTHIDVLALGVQHAQAAAYYALAMGAHTAACLSVSTSDVYTHRHAALSIHDWAQEHGCKRVMLGHQDTGTIVVSGMTAAYLGWSQLSHVTQCHWADQHWVCRVFPDNGIYRIAADTPVVMTINSRICTPRIPTAHDIQRQSTQTMSIRAPISPESPPLQAGRAQSSTRPNKALSLSDVPALIVALQTEGVVR